MTCDFAKKLGIDIQGGLRPQKKFLQGGHWTILVNTKQYYAMIDSIRKVLPIWDNWLTFLRILLQLRKDRAEKATWTILNNIRQYLTIYSIGAGRVSGGCLEGVWKVSVKPKN